MPRTETTTTRALSAGALAELRAFLDDAFATAADGPLTDDDWAHTLGGWHVIARDGEQVVAHAAVVPRQLEFGEQVLPTGYVEAVATAPQRRGIGLGSLVMAEVGRLLPREFAVGALATGAHGFYERLGWERWRGPAFVRRGDELVRTPEEDDAIMVLRFGPSRGLDLADPIVCEERPGDDW